jgi:hypothetical protein
MLNLITQCGHVTEAVDAWTEDATSISQDFCCTHQSVTVMHSDHTHSMWVSTSILDSVPESVSGWMCISDAASIDPYAVSLAGPISYSLSTELAEQMI